MSNRKFYKYTFTLVVLTEGKIPDGMDLEEVIGEAMDGEYSMSQDLMVKEIDGATAAKELLIQHSDPAFFNLNDEGIDLDPE